MSTALFEIKSSKAGSLLARFGLSHKSKNGKCTVIKDKSFVKALYPSSRSYAINW